MLSVVWKGKINYLFFQCAVESKLWYHFSQKSNSSWCHLGPYIQFGWCLAVWSLPWLWSIDVEGYSFHYFVIYLEGENDRIFMGLIHLGESHDLVGLRLAKWLLVRKEFII